MKSKDICIKISSIEELDHFARVFNNLGFGTQSRDAKLKECFDREFFEFEKCPLFLIVDVFKLEVSWLEITSPKTIYKIVDKKFILEYRNIQSYNDKQLLLKQLRLHALDSLIEDFDKQIDDFKRKYDEMLVLKQSIYNLREQIKKSI